MTRKERERERENAIERERLNGVGGGCPAAERDPCKPQLSEKNKEADKRKN